MTKQLLARVLVFTFLGVTGDHAYGAKVDTAFTTLITLVANLEHRLGEAQVDSIELVRLNEKIAAQDQRIDYLSNGNDQAITIAWAALGLIAVIALAIVVLNYFTHRAELLGRLTKSIAALNDHVEQTTEARIEEKMRPEIERLDSNDTRIEVRALFAEKDFRAPLITCEQLPAVRS